MKIVLPLIVGSAAGVAFWAIASLVLDSREPWDSPHYIAWYLAALTLGGVLGILFARRAWLWGALIIFGQLPVMLLQTGSGSFIALGLGILVLEAVPACLVSMAAGKARTVWRRRV